MATSPFRLRVRIAHALWIAALAAATANAQTVTAPPDQGTKNLSEAPLELPTFEVTTSLDKGYRAGNSVSATRIDTPIKDLPFAINAFTKQFMDDIAARDLFDVVRYAPSVTTASKEFTSGNTVYNVRGFDQKPQRNGFLSDAYVDTVNIERVEVVKGPASVLYGQVAPGGVVNYITKHPKMNPFAELGIEVGTDSFFRSKVDVNQPLVKDRVAARFNGAWENGSRYFNNTKSHTWVIAPSLTLQLTDRIKLTSEYQWFQRREFAPVLMKPPMLIGGLSNFLDSSNPGFQLHYPLPHDFNYASRNDKRDSDFESINEELSVKLSDHWTGRANFNWNKSRVRQKLTGVAGASLTVPAGMTAAQFAAAVLANPAEGLKSPTAIMSRRARFEESFAQDHAFQVEVVGRYDWAGAKITPLFGYYRQNGSGRFRQRQLGNAFPAWDLANPSTWNYDTDFDPASLPVSNDFSSKGQNSAAYAVLSGSFMDNRLSVVVGTRYNEAKSSGRNNFFNTDGPVFTSKDNVPQAGVGFKVTRDMLVYASYSESFVVNAANLQKNNQIAGPAAPTTSKGYELGVKTDFLSGRVSSTIAVYQIDQKDRVVSFFEVAPDGSILGSTIQGTVDRSKGIEAEITFSPTDSWQIYASASIDDIRVRSVPSGMNFYLGAHPEATAKAMANLWTRYNLQGSMKGLWIGGGINHTGKKAATVSNPALFLPEYTLGNLSLGYDWKRGKVDYSLLLSWKNITNEEYYPAIQLRGEPEKASLSLTARF